MNKPGFAAALAAALFYSVDGAAFQLGQLRSSSSQGQPLAARIELYGLSAADAARLELTLKPDIRLAHDDPARGVVDAIEASVARDAAGQPYIALRSAAPIGLGRLAFRLRAGLGERASIAHLALDLPPGTPVVRRRPGPHAAPPSATGTVGPVRPGDSLWRILDNHGLAGGDVAATMARVVADNPHAFVDGDANRLRVGVMLTLPATRGATAAAAPRRAPAPAAVAAMPPAAAAATRPAVATRRTLPGTRDEALQARLDALSEKFAAIRARYENGTPSAATALVTADLPNAEPSTAEAASPVTRESPVVDAAAATTAPLEEAATIPAAAPTVTAAAGPAATQASAPAVAPDASAPVEVQPVAPRAAATPAQAADAVPPEIPVSRLLLLAVAGTVSLVALVSGIGTALRRLRARRRLGTERAADEEKVAEIARKATRRLALEEDVRRRLGGQGNDHGADASDAGTNDSRFSTIDTHLAHGHYREAEALLGDIIAAAPDNYRAGLRLLELYYLERRGEDFAALAGALQREHRDEIDDEAWQRVMRMGKVLTPNHPPFSGPVALARTA